MNNKKTFLFLNVILTVFLAVSIVYGYHSFVMQPKLEESTKVLKETTKHLGFYMVDLELLTTVKSASLIIEHQKGLVDISDPIKLKDQMAIFKVDMTEALKEIAGEAPVFTPNTVVSANKLIDITPIVANSMGLTLDDDFISNLMQITPESLRINQSGQ